MTEITVEQQLEAAQHTIETAAASLRGAAAFTFHGGFFISERERDAAVEALEAIPTEPVKSAVELEGMLRTLQGKCVQDTDALFLARKNAERERDQALAVLAEASRIAHNLIIPSSDPASVMLNRLLNVLGRAPGIEKQELTPAQRYEEYRTGVSSHAGIPMPYWKWFEKNYDVNGRDETITYVGDSHQRYEEYVKDSVNGDGLTPMSYWQWLKSDLNPKERR